MRNYLIPFLLLAFVLVVVHGRPTILEGRWEGYLEPSKDHLWTFIFKNDVLIADSHGSPNKTHEQNGVFSLNASASPKHINVFITSGPYVGNITLGIFELKPHHTTTAGVFAFNEPDSLVRPTSFDSSKYAVFNLARHHKQN
jgi:uncharacterized protein (TIGR03067 family)